MNHTLKPQSDGYLIINPGIYKPGDTLYLSGNFKAVAIYNLVGSVEAPIKITNLPGAVTTIGDPAWSGGSWGHGLAARGCKYLEICPDQNLKGNFILEGSTSTKLDSNGFPVRTAYMPFMLTELTDNVKVHHMVVRNGGIGIVAKTDVSATNQKTWFPNTYLENFEFYENEIYGCYNEGMYIGHTAPYWNIKTTQPVSSGAIDPAIMKQPVKLRNVKIYNNLVHDVQNDAIQTAAIDNLEIYNNKVENWAIKKDGNHNGGILVGGRVVGFDVHDNQVKNGWGEFIQIYADAGKAIVRNNLLVSNTLSGVGLRGGKDLAVEFTNNTIVNAGDHSFRINGSTGGTGKNILRKNIIIQAAGRYIYLENGGVASDEDNKKFKTVAEAGLSPETYLPVAGSVSVGYGYSAGTIVEPPAPPAEPAKVTISSNELAAFVKGLKAGTYEVSVGVDSVVRKVVVRVD